MPFAKNLSKNIGKDIIKNLSEYSQTLLDQVKKLQQMQSILLHRKQFKEHPRQLVIMQVIQFLIKLQKSQKLYHKIQRRLNMKQKYQNKNIYPQKKATNC